MTIKDVASVTALEEKHMISILLLLSTHGPSRKIDIYDGVSSNPRMPDKLNILEGMGLITQEVDSVTRSTIVSLTEPGEQIAGMLVAIDCRVKELTRARAD